MSYWYERFEKVIEELESRVIMPERAPSLLPTLEGIKLLGYSYDPKKVILVAGTNGKGSTSATLEALLINSGKSVGLYTSPHLVDTTERIRIQGKNVSFERFCLAYDKLKKSLPKKVHSHFEMLTLMAVEIFLSEKVPLDYMIFEVGLGGTWDATNAIEHKTSVITTLGFDHQDILGESLWEIAKNKLGIIRDSDSEHKVIHAPWPEEIIKLVKNREVKSKASFIEREHFSYHVVRNGLEPEFYVETKWGKGRLGLPGVRGAQNSVLALTVFNELGFDPSQHIDFLANVSWTGRMDSLIFDSKRIFLSGDHNPQGIDSLAEILQHYDYKNIFILAGIGKSKDFNNMLERLFAIPRAKVVLTETPFRGLALKDYGPWQERSWYAHSQPMRGLEKILDQVKSDDMILVSGSLYLVGAIRRACLSTQ